MRKLSLTPEVIELVRNNAVVAFGISGGKDSGTMVHEVSQWLDEVGHPMESRICFHADLGIIDWPQTPEWVRLQNAHAGTQLKIVRRTKGDMVDRWEQRWEDNVKRFEEMSCVKLITPWSNSQWRFCTGELKVAPIVAALKKMFPGRDILNLVGIRKQESTGRAKKPVLSEMSTLKVKTKGTRGWQWNPILDYTVDDVFEVHKEAGLPLHPAYTEYGSDRLSCAYCVLATNSDHLAALACQGNHASYKRLIDLEIRSSFSFKPNDWLCERQPSFLGPFSHEIIAEVKHKSSMRREASDAIPVEMQYTKGWPTQVPTMEQAGQLARMRAMLHTVLKLNCQYLLPRDIIGRYEELMEMKESK